MPLRKTGEDSHGLFLRFNCSLYRPIQFEPKTKIRERQLVYVYQLNSMEFIDIRLETHSETWQNHGPFKYDNNKYIKTDLIWNP